MMRLAEPNCRRHRPYRCGARTPLPQRLGLLLAAFGLCGCQVPDAAPTTSAGTPVATNNSAVKLPLPPPRADGSYRLTADELFECYRVDKGEASRFLEGKTVVVDGRIFDERTNLEKDKKAAQRGEPTNPELVLYVEQKSNGFWTTPFAIVCRFAEEDRPQLRRLLKEVRHFDDVLREDRAVVRGVIADKFGDVILEGCSLEGVIAADGSPAPASARLTSAKATGKATAHGGKK
jgi:hypothetical protein